ncbi:hypothetical protein BU24DRAFT_420928 [Aaosphaeria arxii CBS 175.79]|uniref:MARVEL domain-containing protein n=1 Tax=Aaosphaeria arxii CBS 175.79 TaxID=1450172 RepID=A0A6A5XX08_9PLEO|nr:uncharacterized protein BU24DRAFT_420928 [Aaosphaeria arxii CBS 175.79]KAF2017868.1 hypothetical protein BU24DRAFT_420928 [Aaosphaeria arxii CBS 175.79]
MGTGSKILSVLLRFCQLSSATIVVGLLSRFFHQLHVAPFGSTNGRLVYAEVIACLALVASIILIFPSKFSFYAWPVDVLLFILLIIAFGLLAGLNASCSSNWYWNYWGWNWGGFWGRPRPITVGTAGRPGCSSWRAILAFLFIGAIAWMFSAILGGFVSSELREDRAANTKRSIKERLMNKNKRAAQPETQETGYTV